MQTSNHPIEQQELMAYLDGELAPERVEAVTEHLRECSECSRLAADLGNVSARLAAWKVETVDSRIPEDVADALDHHRAARKAGGMLRRWGWAYAAGACAVGLVAALQLTSNAHIKYIPPPQAAVSLLMQSETNESLGRVPSVKAENPLIARTTQLVLVRNDVNGTRARIEAIVKAHKGYIGELTQRAPAQAEHSLEITLHIPSTALEAVMTELRQIGRVESESQAGEDVTKQSADLQARLANARNTERRLTGLLKDRTGDLSDVLSVEKEIDRVRGEIEAMESEAKSLANRVDFATINVRVTEEQRAQLHHPPGSLFTRVRVAATEGYETLAGTLLDIALGILSYGPTLLFWCAILFWPARFAWRKLRKPSTAPQLR